MNHAAFDKSSVTPLRFLWPLICVCLFLWQCGGPPEALTGNWLLHRGSYQRELLRFYGGHCEILRWSHESGRQDADISNITYDYDATNQRLTFQLDGRRVTTDMVFFTEGGQSYFRLLNPAVVAEKELAAPAEPEKQEPPEKQTGPASDSFIAELIADAPLKPLVFRAEPDWVLSRRGNSFSKIENPLNGLWVHRIGRGEDNCLMQITMKSKSKGVFLARTESLDAFPVSGSHQIRVDTSAYPHRLSLSTEKPRYAVFEYLERDIMRLRWLTPEEGTEWPKDTQGGGLFRRRDRSCDHALSEVVGLSEKIGLPVRISRPGVFSRFPGLDILPVPDTQCQAFEQYIPLLEQELGKYPPGLIAENVDEIALVGFVALKDQERGGYAHIHRSHRRLFLQITAAQPAFILHHNFFQLLDEQHGGAERFTRRGDWLRIHAIHQVTGGGKPPQTMPETLCATADQALKGFVSQWAEHGYGNDRAQVFAALMTDGGPCRQPKEIVADAALVDKIYLIYREYPTLLEPTINRWIETFGLPDLKRQTGPTFAPPEPPPIVSEPETVIAENKEQPEPEAESPDTTRPEPKKPMQRTGIMIKVNPSDATITAGGREYPSSPAFVDVPPGSYEVRAEKPNFQSVSKTVEVPSGKMIELELTLPPIARTKPKVEPDPTPSPGNNPTGKLEVYFEASSGMARRKWKQILIHLDEQNLHYEPKEDHSEPLLEMQIPAAQYHFSIGSDSYKPIDPILLTVVGGKTTKIECKVKGLNGKKLTITINGNTLLEDLKMENN